MIYHNIAIDVPLNSLFTYSYDKKIPVGRRVCVRFRGKKVAGVVLQSDVKPEIEISKIQAVEQVFDNEPIFTNHWIELLKFTSHYYHYPIGSSVFCALPVGLRLNKEVKIPSIETYFSLSQKGRLQLAPPSSHHKLYALWQSLADGFISESLAKKIHPQANKYLSKWQNDDWLISQQNQAARIDNEQNKINLNEYQQNAVNTISQSLGSFNTFLLLGITGSGKTETYFEVIAKALSQGKQVLFLVPEINLTQQLLARLHKRFPNLDYVVLHSKSPDGERTQNYLRAMQNQVQLIIGTRLAVFTPIDNLGLIVVDEEHDSSFKQQDELRYNARDLAIWRAKQMNCPIILGSATPSLESFQAALNQRYTLLELPIRANKNAKLPEIIVSDIRRQKLHHGFSENTLKYLEENLHNGGLSLVYINRRGFAPAIFCEDCGHAFVCPNCSAKMVFHRVSAQLRCHHCDHKVRQPEKCPECDSQNLIAIGVGTQRVEDMLREYFANAKIVRIDSDSTKRKDDWANFYQQISQGEVDIIIGTQMLAKGHNFERLNLVVVLNADGSLYSADFRAIERLFAELMQVSGRAGRAEHKGRVIIQTRLPNNELFTHLKTQDYKSFAREELNKRKVFNAPPTSYSAVCRADAFKLKEAMDFLNKCLETFRLPEQINVYGPAPQLMVKLAGRERAQIFFESDNRTSLHQIINQMDEIMRKTAKHYKNIRHSIDVDPQDF